MADSFRTFSGVFEAVDCKAQCHVGLALLILPGVEPDVRQLHEPAIPADGEVRAVALGAHELVEHIVGHEAVPPVDSHDLIAGLQAGLAAEGVVLYSIDDLAGDGLTAQ